MNKTIEELVLRFWQTHDSHNLSKNNWTLKKSVDALLPMLAREAYEAGQVEERKNSEQVIGAILYSANHHHAVYVNDEALLEKYDIEKRIDHSSLRSVFIANLATLKAKTDE